MKKIKTITIEKRTFKVKTEIITNRETKVLTGEPMIAMMREHVQIGCIRMNYDALDYLYALVHNRRGIYQQGTYKTNDPLTCLIPEQLATAQS